MDKNYVPGLICIKDMPFSTLSATGSEIQPNAKYSRITPNACNEYVPSALVYRLYECDNQVTPVR